MDGVFFGMHGENEGDGSELIEKIHDLKRKKLKIKAKLLLLHFLAQHHEAAGRGLGSEEMKRVSKKMYKLKKTLDKKVEHFMACKYILAHHHHQDFQEEEENAHHEYHGLHKLAEKLHEKKKKLIVKFVILKTLLRKYEEAEGEEAEEKVEKLKEKLEKIKEKKHKIMLFLMLAQMILAHNQHHC